MPEHRMTWEEFQKMLKELPGNDAKYDVSAVAADENSLLKGKMIIYLGSSVTFGAASFEQSFIDLSLSVELCHDILSRKPYPVRHW